MMFVEMFGSLYEHLNPAEIMPSIELFMCQLFGMTQSIKSVDDARYELFIRRLKKNGIIDISVLPPCLSVLELHAKRSALIHYLWKQSRNAVINIPDIADSGWYHDGEICFTSEVYPAELEDVFVCNEEDEEDGSEDEDEGEEYYGSDFNTDEESDDEF